jgi:hypothetical protein
MTGLRHTVVSLAKAFGSRQLSGADILSFLRTFEGAAATFSEGSGHWSLWLPEFSPDGHPLTPASQIFFPVILRRDDQAFAIRFFYDCSTGKVRYYTSAIPDEIARLPELENAISELFRHSLPVEAIRQRSLGKKNRRPVNEPALQPRPVHAQSLADPDERPLPAGLRPPPIAPLPAPAVVPAGEAPAPNVPPVSGLPPPGSAGEATPGRADRAPAAPEKAPVPVSAPPAPVTVIVPKPRLVAEASAAPRRVLVEVPPNVSPPSSPREVTRTVRVELGPRAHMTLLVIVLAVAAAVLTAIGAYVYLQITRDPGIEHHRLQIEEMRMRNGG